MQDDSRASVAGLRFDGRIAVVTGAASGIGRATAAALARQGVTVAIIDRDIANGTAFTSELNREGNNCAAFFALDVSDSTAVAHTITQIAQEFGGVDLLAHCAGIQSYGSATSTSPEEWRRVLAVDLDSAFFVSRAALPHIAARRGSIVFIGSTQSVVAHRNSAAYVTGKHALLGLTRSIALDFADQGVRCNCVLPGAIDTPMIRWGASREPNPQAVLDACSSLALFNRMGTPEEVANAVLFLLSDMASFITGTSLVVDGGQLVPCGGTAFQRVGTGGEPVSERKPNHEAV
jgi:NAD(P)-dependent dehydrogenase (short-subunit alcohol dehydrogenase family)